MVKTIPTNYPELAYDLQQEIIRLKEQLDFREKELDMYRHAVGTFESYLQSTGIWDNIKKMKEVIEQNCPTKDVDVLWNNFWGHRCVWDEESKEDEE